MRLAFPSPHLMFQQNGFEVAGLIDNAWLFIRQAMTLLFKLRVKELFFSDCL